MNIIVTLLTSIAAVVFLLVLFYKRRYSFWIRRGVLTPPMGFMGHLWDVALKRKTLAITMLDVYNFLRSKNAPYGGIYNFFFPVFVPVDINIIKAILQNDFEHFSDRGLYFNEKDDPLSATIFTLKVQKWKKLKSILSPTFTPVKLKMMFETILHCSDEMSVILKISKGKPLNVKDISARYTTDIIGNCAFGIDCNSLKEPNNDFRERGNAFFRRTLFENFMMYFSENIPDLMKLMRFRVNRPEVLDFFMGLIRDTIAFREQNNIYRKDFLHLLIQLKHGGELNDEEKSHGEENGLENEKLTFEEICAQCFLFFIAAFETSSSTISFCLYLLAMHEEIQNRVRKEIKNIISQNSGNLTYDALSQMEYLESVILETLRMYPVSTILNRMCTKDYKVPGTDLVLKKGQVVYIPVMGIHYDEKYYAEPEKFDPDRFSEENRKDANSAPFLTFGYGPRICLGLRFSMIQIKVALVAFLQKHKFSISKKMKVPLEFDFQHPLLSPKGGLWLDFIETED